MNKNIKTKIIYIHILALLGLFLFLYYIWFRFIRERLPRDIPFQLTSLGFLFLLFICIFYLYVFYRSFKPTNSFYIKDILYYYLNLILKSFYFFDKIIKKNIYINNFIMKTFYYTIKYLKLYDTFRNEYFFFFMNVLPQITLISIFVLDIFYWQQFYLFYKCIIFCFFPLSYRYSIYSITKILETSCNKLDKYYYVKMLSTIEDEKKYESNMEGTKYFVSLNTLKYYDDVNFNILHSEYFIKVQSYNLIFDHDLYEYTCIETWDARELYIKKYKLERPVLWVFEPESDEISKILAKEFRELMPMAYYFKAFIDTHNDLTKPEFLKYDKYFILTYLVCWLYILIISFHTLDLLELTKLLKSTIIMQDPYSELSLFYYESKTNI